jgi:peptidoglycan/LPS O-acetylase OafA/YrhL
LAKATDMESLQLKGNTLLPVTLREGLSSSHLPGLDGLRMVAVSLVVFYHLGFTAAPGSHGVLTFFVLSGFLITWLFLKEQERFGTFSLRLFYLRRALRIFPAFYCFWLVWTAALLLFDKPIVWGQALSALGYLTNYYQAILGDPGTGYSHTWSLAIEEQFYLLWPVVLLALGQRSGRIVVVLAVVIGTIWVYRGVLEFVVGVDQEYIYEAFDTRADHLAMGCLLAVLLRSGRLPRLWGWLCISWMSILTLALLVTSMWLAQTFGTVYRNVVGFAIDPVLVALLIAQVIALRESWLWRWLNWRWVRYLGTLSYSIYLYQQVVIHPVQQAFMSYPLPVMLGATLATVILLASASYHFVEQPFLRLKNTIASPSAGRRRRRVLGQDSLDYVHGPV